MDKNTLYQWYVIERMSYRQIMQKLGINNARKVKKLLTEAGIKPRERSEAIKTQWEDNEQRRKRQAEKMSKISSGKKSPRRKSENELANILLQKGLIFQKREIIDGYTYMYYICPKCGYKGKTSLRSLNGCVGCGIQKNTVKQKLGMKKIKEEYKKYNLIVVETYYKNTSQPIAFICEKHPGKGIQYVSYNKLKEKKFKGCVYCSYELRRKKELPKWHRERNQDKLKQWRESVFERDNYTCQKCGDSSGGSLQSHHIENYLTSEKGRFDVNNGITLCKRCHDPAIKGSFHNIYGTYQNNKKQLQEFLQLTSSNSI